MHGVEYLNSANIKKQFMTIEVFEAEDDTEAFRTFLGKILLCFCICNVPFTSIFGGIETAPKIITIIIIKVLKKRILHIKFLDAFYNSKKRALTKHLRFHSPFKTINTVALSNGKR